jgi:hypothetical protein
MPIDYGRPVPPGVWIQFRKLPDYVTEEEIQVFLADRGVEVPIERVSVSRGDYTVWATVSFEHEALRDLLDRAIQREKLHGVEMNPCVPMRRAPDPNRPKFGK